MRNTLSGDVSEPESAKRIISNSVLGESTNEKVITYVLSWKYHYESWKLFKKEKKYLLVILKVRKYLL